MSKARVLANLISDNAELADGQISVAEVVGAAPLASPTFTGNIDAGDNVKIRLGDSDDLQIYHDGDDSYIADEGTGNLTLKTNGTKILMETAGGNTLAEFINNGNVVLYSNDVERLRTNGTGISVTGNATFADNGKAIFGAGSDLQIYHDGSSNHTFITETGSGHLYVRADNLKLQSAGGDNYAQGIEGAGFFLYHDDIEKLKTTTTGIDVTGSVSISDYIIHSGDSDTFFGFSNANQIYFQAGNSRNLDLGPVSTVFNQDAADIDFRVESNNNNNMILVNAGSDRVSIGMSGGSETFNVKGSIQIDHEGSNTFAKIVGPDNRDLKVVLRANDNGDAFIVEDDRSAGSERLTVNAGGEMIVNNTSADYDFRVESANQANMLKVDAGNDSVAINRSNGSAPLHVSGDPNDTVAPEHAYAKFTAQGLDGLAFGSFASGTYASWIQSGYTSNTYSPDWNNGYAMLLNPAGGNVGIRDTEPQVDLHVGGGGHIRSDVIGGKIGWGSGGGSPWYSYIQSSNDGSQNVGLEFFTTTNAGTANINHLHMHPDNGTIFNEASVDMDFIVKGDTRTLIAADGGNAQNVSIGTGVSTNQTSLNVSGGITISNAYDDANLNAGTTIVSPLSAVGGGALETTYGIQGTMRSATDIILEYRATSWKSFAWEVHVSNTRGYVVVRAGGYSNGSCPTGATMDLINGTNPLSAATQVNQNNQMVRLKLDSGGSGVHTSIRVVYHQNGNDGTPKANRMFFTVNY